MNKPLSYKVSNNESDYVLVHKRALVSTSHCLGLALKSYSICSGCDMQEITRQLAYHANRHAHELTEQQLEIVIEKLIKHQGDSGVLELKDDLLNENTN